MIKVDRLKTQIKKRDRFTIYYWLIISFGILVRLVQYLYNRSLWADEAVLALNIVNRSYRELGQPLDYDQAAPIGFLWIKKLSIDLLGNNEYALRLFPFIAGIGSIFLFVKASDRFLKPRSKFIALALFSSLNYLVYYSSEVKQYSVDVAVALILFLVLYPLERKKINLPKTIITTIIVSCCLWLSHPAILILGSMGIIELVLLIKKTSQEYIIKIIPKLFIYIVSLTSFIICYFNYIKPASNNDNLQNSWGSAFPSSIFDIVWYLDTLGKFFYKPLGFATVFDCIAILFFIIGCIVIYKKNKLNLLYLLSPLLITLIAATLKLYPFRSRLVLFLTPFFIIAISQGSISTINWARQSLKLKKIKTILTTSIVSLLITYPVIVTGEKIFKPQRKEEIKEVLQYLQINKQPGDILYIYQRGIYQFQYYAEKYDYQPEDYIIGVDDLDNIYGKGLSEPEWQRYKADLDKLRGNNRVWLLFSHANVRSENKAIKEYLDTIGSEKDYFATKGSYIYLYNLP